MVIANALNVYLVQELAANFKPIETSVSDTANSFYITQTAGRIQQMIYQLYNSEVV